jgi:hypothetical protein
LTRSRKHTHQRKPRIRGWIAGHSAWDYYLNFNRNEIPEETSLKENGIEEHGKELRLFVRNIPAA